MVRSNLPQHQKAYACEDEWDRRREGGVIEARTAIQSRLLEIEWLEACADGRLFLSTRPPVIRFQGVEYVPFEAWQRFSEQTDRLVEARAARLARRDGRTRGGAPVARPSRVYFIQDERDGSVKIGRSVDPRGRLTALRCANGGRHLALRATMPGAAAEERALHARFGSLRIRGEWFRPEPELLEFIASSTEPWQ